MSTPRIYHPDALHEQLEITLFPSATNHVVRVLRMKTHQTLVVFNGDGKEYMGEIIAIEKHVARIRIQQGTQPAVESPLNIHLGQGISKGERMDYAIQKATELGVNKITPLFTQRCEVKLDSTRAQKRQAHWQQIAISACEQSGRCKIPEIALPCSLFEWFKQKLGDAFICDTEANLHWPDAAKISNKISLLIGPEGGLAEEEIQMALAQKFHRLSLGPRILRTETAPVVALTLLQSHYGDLG